MKCSTEIALLIANRFLKQSFDDGVKITRADLQILIYLFYREYLFRTKQKLFSEEFMVSSRDVPMLMSVYTMFVKYGKYTIDDFYLERDGRYKFINLLSDKRLYLTFFYIWGIYLTCDKRKLIDMVQVKGGAVDIAKKNGQCCLKDIDIYNEILLLRGK